MDEVLRVELDGCVRNCPKGVIVQPSVRKSTQWHVYLMPERGVFRCATITCAIYFDRFPDTAPQIDFQSGVFHPLVNPRSSTFDIDAIFPTWTSRTRVHTLLTAIYDAFIDIPLPEKAANPEAVQHIRHDRNIFANKAIGMLQKPDSPMAARELNTPERWNPQKEELAGVLNKKR